MSIVLLSIQNIKVSYTSVIIFFNSMQLINFFSIILGIVDMKYKPDIHVLSMKVKLNSKFLCSNEKIPGNLIKHLKELIRKRHAILL